MARPTTAARRYAEAAFEVALRDGTVAAWRRDLALAANGLADERVMRVLTNPAIPLASRAEVLDEALAGAARGVAAPAVSQPVRNLVLLLLHRGRIDLLQRVAAEFKRLDDRRLGITPATATSAAPLEPTEVRGLTVRLEQLTGGSVELDLQVDPGILGGLIVRVGDRLIDGSVRGRLERLRNRLAPGAL
jgi:F-type H+-transporting ATPase subunit delta